MSGVLRWIAGVLCFFAGLAGACAHASSSFEVEAISDVFHITADRTLYHSRERVKEAFGHVVVSGEGKRLAADYIWVDDNTKDIKARGNVLFVDRETTVEAAELHFNLNTGIGAIFYGRVYNDAYSLRGQLIRRVGDERYLTTEGEYSTCKDCPESWKLAARHVDLTVDGYAFMDGVFIKIKDIPTLYIPYLIVPVKTRRQTGFLFPRIGGASSHGFVFVQPFFLAIDRHQDLTLAAGRYSQRGMRYEGEYRYVSFDGISGTANAYFTRDGTYGPEPNRGALVTRHEWPFWERLGVRWRLLEVKDRDYVLDFPEDLTAGGRPAVESNFVAQSPWRDLFVSAELRRYRNLVYDSPIGFDGGTVQALPTVHAGLRERKLAGPLLGSFYGRYDNFTRANGGFTDLNGNGIFDPVFADSSNPERLRKAQRFHLAPELSMPFSLGAYLSLTPSLQYNDTSYRFSLPAPNAPLDGTSTRYLRARLEASTVLERVYDYDGEQISKLKHQLVPFLSYSYIPAVNQDSAHPFQKQLLISDGLFDQFDIVPMTNSTNFLRFPQGNSLYYGFESRLVRKKKRADEMPRTYPYDLLPVRKARSYPVPRNRKQELQTAAQQGWDEFDPHYDLYQEIWSLNVSQAYDLLEARSQRENERPENRARGKTNDWKRAFSYLLAKSNFTLDDRFSHRFEYRYYPALVVRSKDLQEEVLHDMQNFTSSLVWYWKKLANLRRTRFFERSISLDFTFNDRPNPSRSVGGTIAWSFNDFVNIKLSEAFDLNTEKQKSWSASTLLAHPSECWGVAFRWDWQRSRSPNAGEIGFELLLNLTGAGFMGAKSLGSGGSVFGGN